VKIEPTDALLIVDVLNDLEFPGGEKVLPHQMVSGESWGISGFCFLFSRRAARNPA